MSSPDKIQPWPRGAQDLPDSEVPLDVQPRATLSADGRYRFTLLRDCGDAALTGAVAWLMLNPSKADSDQGDHTITRCSNYTKSWGYRWIYVVNLSPFRAQKPKDLFEKGREPDNVWQTNIAVIKAAVENADLLVAAYGGNGKWEDRAERVMEELKNVDIQCLDTTDDGHPVHPLQRRRRITDYRLYRGRLGRSSECKRRR